VDFGDAAQGADIRPDLLSGGLDVLHVAGEELAAERQDFVLFGKPVQAFVNAHALIVALHPVNSFDDHCHHELFLHHATRKKNHGSNGLKSVPVTRLRSGICLPS
jgi:hypothetical protein